MQGVKSMHTHVQMHLDCISTLVNFLGGREGGGTCSQTEGALYNMDDYAIAITPVH